MRYSLVANGTLQSPHKPEVSVPWWSFGKTVLAAAALTLVRDGLIRLDDEVLEGPFTLRQLLQHQAGLADYGELPEYHAAVAQGETPWPADEMLQRLDTNRLRYAPGSGWRYSNVGYLYVTRLLERVTRLPLADVLEARVFAPLDMTAIRLATTCADLEAVSMGADAGYDPRWVYHGLLVGPLSQAALLLDRLLSGPLLPRALLDEMHSMLALGGPIPGRPWTVPGYALGLMIGTVDSGLTLCGHTGSGPNTVVAIYRSVQGKHTATCAVFSEGEDQGKVETQALLQLSQSLLR